MKTDHEQGVLEKFGLQKKAGTISIPQVNAWRSAAENAGHDPGHLFDWIEKEWKPRQTIGATPPKVISPRPSPGPSQKVQIHPEYAKMIRTGSYPPEILEKFSFNAGAIARGAAPYALGAGIPLAALGGLLLSKPGIQSSLREKWTNTGNTESKDLNAAIPQETEGIAQRVHEAILAKGLDPTTLRIAVDAPPGTGKSTLSRALVNRMGVKHYGLDWLPPEQREFGGGQLDKMVRGPRAGEVLEHHNLLRTHDPELFDAAIYISKDPETIKQRVIQRGRSAGLADFYNYPKTIGVGHLAFNTLAGDAIPLGGDAYLKLRPHEGWGADRLDAMLQDKGIDPASLTRHEKLLSLYEGKRTTGHGWLPYAKSPLTEGETGFALGSIPVGIGAALAAAKYLR